MDRSVVYIHSASCLSSYHHYGGQKCFASIALLRSTPIESIGTFIPSPTRLFMYGLEKSQCRKILANI